MTIPIDFTNFSPLEITTFYTCVVGVFSSYHYVKLIDIKIVLFLTTLVSIQDRTDVYNI